MQSIKYYDYHYEWKVLWKYHNTNEKNQTKKNKFVIEYHICPRDELRYYFIGLKLIQIYGPHCIDEYVFLLLC